MREFFDRERNLGIILMLPGAVLLIAFMAYPFFLGIWFSLTDSMIGRPGQFIGLRNFVDLLTDTIFHQTAKNTLIYALVTVPFKAMLGLGLALVLNRICGSAAIRRRVDAWIIPNSVLWVGSRSSILFSVRSAGYLNMSLTEEHQFSGRSHFGDFLGLLGQYLARGPLFRNHHPCRAAGGSPGAA
jgi:multiple sugar transport system permease protein